MKRVFSVLSIVSSLVLLSGCDSSIAAQVGDTKISQSTVQSRISEILSERRNYDTSGMEIVVGEELNRSQLRFLVVSAIFEKLAKQYGITITEAMKDAHKAQIYDQIGGISELPQALVRAQMAPGNFDLYVQSVLISDALVAKAKSEGVAEDQTGVAVQQMVQQLVKKDGIKINPQYGAWDEINADLVPFDPANTAVKTSNS